MTLSYLLLEELDREVPRSRRALEQVPANRDDWKPHDKSMPLGRLASMLATMPSWIGFIVRQDELDPTPPGGNQWQPPSHAELVSALEKSAADGRAALSGVADDALLNSNWRLRAGGKVVSNTTRYVALRDLLNHTAHHRGQLTVYLRLLNATVPAIYGPSADDQRFL